MASAAAFAVNGSSATQIASGAKHIVVQNLGPYAIFLGGSGVDEASGVQVNPDQGLFPVPVGLLSLENLYAIAVSAAGSNTSDVRVLSYAG